VSCIFCPLLTRKVLVRLNQSAITLSLLPWRVQKARTPVLKGEE
jgi:hypothetical protein